MDKQTQKDILVHKTFKAMLNILVIFSLPAFAALFLGKFLQDKISIGFNIIWPLLAGAFIFSWVMTFRLYFKISEEFKKLDQEKENSK
ncbi:MAG TPA: hypothetical protein P5230_04145 [Candidatus Magasanikbacteria bacterium]|nr:hypothetical protein [Candidatus Magasanikbacteria bacterium]